MGRELCLNFKCVLKESEKREITNIEYKYFANILQ